VAVEEATDTGLEVGWNTKEFGGAIKSGGGEGEEGGGEEVDVVRGLRQMALNWTQGMLQCTGTGRDTGSK
jgi:hypothetical protein